MLIVAFMFFIRYLWLTILMIISPIVWLFWVIPSLEGEFHKWWSKFLEWVFFAPAVSFFIYLALFAMQEMSRQQPLTTSVLSFFGAGSILQNVMLNGVQMVVLIGLLFGGLLMAKSMGIAGAAAAVGAATIGMKGFGKWYGKKVGQVARGGPLGRRTAEKWAAGEGLGKFKPFQKIGAGNLKLREGIRTKAREKILPGKARQLADLDKQIDEAKKSGDTAKVRALLAEKETVAKGRFGARKEKIVSGFGRASEILNQPGGLLQSVFQPMAAELGLMKKRRAPEDIQRDLTRVEDLIKEEKKKGPAADQMKLKALDKEKGRLEAELIRTHGGRVIKKQTEAEKTKQKIILETEIINLTNTKNEQMNLIKEFESKNDWSQAETAKDKLKEINANLKQKLEEAIAKAQETGDDTLEKSLTEKLDKLNEEMKET